MYVGSLRHINAAGVQWSKTCTILLRDYSKCKHVKIYDPGLTTVCMAYPMPRGAPYIPCMPTLTLLQRGAVFDHLAEDCVDMYFVPYELRT